MGTEETGLETLPVPDDFPVDWEGPDEQRLSFMFGQDHFPRPITPLDFAFFRDVGEYSVGAVAEHYDGPITGWRIRRFNTYLYQANLPYRGTPEEVDARGQRSEEKILRDIGRLGELWEGELLPEIKEHLAWWDAFDREGASVPQLVEHFDETWRRGLRMWDLHFRAILPAYIALSEFDELYRQLFGDASALDAFKVLQGIENKTTEVAAALWNLSRLAIRSDEVRSALERESTAEALESMEAGGEGRAFLAELRSFLERYGQRTDTWVMSAPSWVEDPSLVLKNVRDLLARADTDAPTITTRQAATEREQHVRGARDRLKGYPEPVRAQFEQLMDSARAATVVQDDHNFYVDFCCAFRIRRVILEIGRRFAEAGVIESRDDVFMLTPDELRETGAGLPAGDHRELVAERREEMERFEDYDPPRELGAPPAALAGENAVFRFMAKFYGTPPPPSERADLVQGLPGSGGKARGIARVIRELSEMGRLKPGEVLVTETTAPPWTPVFSTAGAVVTDSGGVLSHAAVVAREYGIPAVVGAAVATATIEDGQLVEVDGSAGTVLILDAAASAGNGDGRPMAAERRVAPVTDGKANGAPDRAPERARGGDGAVAAHEPEQIDAARLVEQLQLRNEDIVSEAEQGLVNTMRVLVAGCGSVGGSVVEPLVRLGVGELSLADPDVYDLNNVNRQACTVADVGRPKVDVHAERARSINPFVRLSTMPDGLTPANVEEAVTAATIVFDGIDPSPEPMKTKYLMHQYAARNRIPVLVGADLGGQPTLYVYDYRRDNRPFYGKADVKAIREGRLFEAMVPLIGLRNVPSDFIPIVLARAAAEPDDRDEQRLMDQLGWPQVSYCTAALGALGTRTIVDVVAGREVPHVVTVDLHTLTRTRRERTAQRLRRPLVLGRTIQTLRRQVRAGAPARPRPTGADPLAGVAPALLPVLEAMRQAPSAHNTQPWLLAPRGDDGIRLEYDRIRRLDVADPEGRYLCHSLGAAIEAANTVARVEWEPNEGVDPLEPGWDAGELVVDGIRESDYRIAAGVLASRGTNRGPYGTQRIDKRVLSRFEEAGLGFGVQVYTSSSPLAIRTFSKLASKAALAHFSHGPYFDEFLHWTRFSKKERDWDPDGFTAEGLGLSPTAAGMLRQMKRNPRVRQAAQKAYLPALMGYFSAGVVKDSAGLVMIATRTNSPRAWIEAGRAMMAIWLEATKASLAVQPIGGIVDIEPLKPLVIQQFGASLSDNPVLILRMGRAISPTPASPRLPLRRLMKPGWQEA